MPRFVVPGDFLPPQQLGQTRTQGLEEKRSPYVPKRSRGGSGGESRPGPRPAAHEEPAALGTGAPRRNPRSGTGDGPLFGGLPLSCRGVREDSAVEEAFSLERRKPEMGSLWVDLVFFNRLIFFLFFLKKPPECCLRRIKELDCSPGTQVP